MSDIEIEEPRPYHNHRFHPADYPKDKIILSVYEGLKALFAARDLYDRLSPEHRKNILAVLSNTDLLR